MDHEAANGDRADGTVAETPAEATAGSSVTAQEGPQGTAAANAGGITTAPREPRQRWRIIFARDALGPDEVGRGLLDEWHGAIRASALPAATQDGDGERPKLAFGAPLQAGAAGEAELVDLWLLERMPLWQVRERLANRLPRGHRWVDAEDIWLGAPPLPGQVIAAHWRAELRVVEGTDRLADAARTLLGSSSLPRTREKGGATRTYDLRPLLEDLSIGPGADRLRIVTRFDPSLGAGRPEEVIGALGDEAGIDIAITALVRERLVLNQASSVSRPAAARPLTPRRRPR